MPPKLSHWDLELAEQRRAVLCQDMECFLSLMTQNNVLKLSGSSMERLMETLATTKELFSRAEKLLSSFLFPKQHVAELQEKKGRLEKMKDEILSEIDATVRRLTYEEEDRKLNEIHHANTG